MSFLSAFFDLLFPPKCVFCHKILESSDEKICQECRVSLPVTEKGGRQKGDFFDYCISPLYYGGDVRKSIHRFKFGGLSFYAETYGELVAECVKENLDEEFDLITWPSLSAARLRKRGYDQARLMAEKVARELGGSVVRTLKKRDVAAQSSIGDGKKRRKNIAEAYTVLDDDLVRGKRFLLIDDVITTGSTLSECARMLRLSGAEKVVCASLARAKPRDAGSSDASESDFYPDDEMDLSDNCLFY